MSELLAVTLITLLATISPGPDFAMVARNSYLYGRNPGLLAALGIALAVQVHVFYTMFGIGLVIAHSPLLFGLIKITGAAYLIYIGWKTFSNKSKLAINLNGDTSVSPMKMFRSGFLTNVLNPKTTLFVVSTYTQVVQPDTPLITQFCYGLFVSCMHFAWFALVAKYFSRHAFRSRILQYQRTVDKGIGAVLMALGAVLALANIAD